MCRAQMISLFSCLWRGPSHASYGALRTSVGVPKSFLGFVSLGFGVLGILSNNILFYPEVCKQYGEPEHLSCAVFKLI